MQNLPHLIAKAESWLNSEAGKSYDTGQFSWEQRAREFEKLL